MPGRAAHHVRRDRTDVGHLDRTTGCLTAEDVLRTFRVRVSDARRRLRHAPHDSQFVEMLGGLREQFSEANSRQLCLYRLERAAVFLGCVGFRIPGIRVRNASLFKQHQNLLRRSVERFLLTARRPERGQRTQPAHAESDEAAAAEKTARHRWLRGGDSGASQ